MTTLVRRTLAAFGCLLCAATLDAEVPPGRWAKMDLQPPGLEIAVMMRDGEKIAGLLKSCAAETLTLAEIDGTERVLRKADIRKVVTRDRRPDELGNGALIGLGAGAVFGALVGALYCADCDCSPAAGSAIYGLIFGGIGAGLGVGIDAAITSRQVLYVAAKP